MTRLALLLLSVVVGGCASEPAVTVRPHGDGPAMRQAFDRAYVSRVSDFGEDRVVLVNSAIDRAVQTSPGRPIEPLADVPLHTVLSIRLHWRPIRSTLQTAVGLNAVLHYYVYGPASADGGPASLLHYVGTGFVTLHDAGDGSDVDVSHGSLSLRERYGQLRDPLGTFTVDGTFHAITSDPRVAEVETDVKDATARAAAAFGPATTRP